MKTINFSKNWNNKLNQESFTTIRLYSAASYKQGDKIQVRLAQNKKVNLPLLVGTITNTRVCKIHQLTEEDAQVDIGSPLAYLHGVLQQMYKFKVDNWNEQLLIVYNVKVNYRYESSQTKLF